MNLQDNLLATIIELVGMKTEGTHWDFKLQHHANNAELIHDVLCLANAEHEGQRYLVFGVEDRTYNLHSIDSSPSRKSQADIAGLFRDNARKFFQSRTPTVYLSELEHDGKSLDVLVIEDRPHKPYYLVDDYRHNDKTVRAHHVYTRLNDTNIPMTEAAPPHEIERMWRERYGLDKTPLERAKRYLSDHEAWESVSENGFFGAPYDYHRNFPEFTLKTAEAEEVIARNEEWTRGEIRRDNNTAWYFEMYYHQTLLARVRAVTFDDGKKSMVAPDWIPQNGGRFYFYQEESIEFALQRFLVNNRHDNDDSKNIRIRLADEDNVRRADAIWPHGYMSIPVLKNRELDEFAGPNPWSNQPGPSKDEKEQNEIFLRNQLDFEEWRQNKDSK